MDEHESDWDYSSDDSSLDLNVYDDEPPSEPLATPDRLDRVSKPNRSTNDLPVTPAQELSESTKSYSYSSLNTAAREIRLLEILPPTQSRSMCCYVSTYHMDIAPVYVALSYEWGDPGATRTIIVNRSRHAIRQNLYEFLSEVNSAGRYKGCLFWIDAICINQEDNKERSHQVSLMAQIYRRAQCVVAWLGKSTSDSLTLMETIAHQSSPLVSSPVEQIWRNLTDRHRAAFRSLCKRSYWTRLWIVQELALASYCEILCGAMSLSWQVFEAILQPAESDKAPTLSTSAYADGHSMVRNSDIHNASHAFTTRQQIALFRSRATLTDHIIACCGLKCQDPLDRVYALLGLMGREYDSITPDYHRERSALITLVLKTQYAHFPPRSLDEIDEHCRVMRDLLEPSGSHSGLNRAGMLRWAASHQLLTDLRLAKQTTPSYDPNADLAFFAAAGNCLAMKVILRSTQFDINLRDYLRSGETALHRAVFGGHEASVALLLQRPDINVNQTDVHGLTALHAACREGRENLVRMMIIKADTEVNTRCNVGASALHLACLSGHHSIVRDLLECKDVDPDLRDHSQQTPLHLAAKSWAMGGTKENFLLFKERGADLNALNGEGRTALHLAIDFQPSLLDTRRESGSLMEMLIKSQDVDVNICDANGWTPLCLAAQRRDVCALKLLLQRSDIKMNTQTSNGMSALHYAVEQGNMQTTEHLLEQPELDYELRDNKGETALHLAARAPTLGSILAMLLRISPIDVDAGDARGRTPLHHAAKFERIDAIKALLQKAAVDVNKCDSNGQSAVHLATLYCADGGLAMAALLERADIDVNACNTQGWAPLHYAVLTASKPPLELLLQRSDIDLNVRSDYGYTPLHIASKHHELQSVSRLLQLADVQTNLRDLNGCTPLHLAVKEDLTHKPTLRLLLEKPDIDVNIRNYSGQTALEYAASIGDIFAVSRLLRDSRVSRDRSLLLYQFQRRPEVERTWPAVWKRVTDLL